MDNLQKKGLTLSISKGGFSHLKLALFFDGKRLSPFSDKVPTDLRRVIRASGSYGGDGAGLRDYFLEENPSFSVEVKVGHQSVSCVWNKSFSFSAKTVLTAKEDKVEVDRYCVDKESVFSQLL